MGHEQNSAKTFDSYLGWICQNTYLTKVPCNFITFCSSSAYFCEFSTFKMANFLPVNKTCPLICSIDLSAILKKNVDRTIFYYTL